MPQNFWKLIKPFISCKTEEVMPKVVMWSFYFPICGM